MQPDIEHHLHISAWKAAFPRAQIIAPDGLREKRAQSNPKGDIPFDFIISRNAPTTLPEDFAREFQCELFDAHANKEIAFLYQPERTLIQADLIFNLPALEAHGEAANTGVLTKLINKYVGSAQGTAKGQQRFLWWAAGAKDRASFARSAKVVNGWDFERIIPCHGEVIETGGKGVFQKLFKWYLDYKQ